MMTNNNYGRINYNGETYLLLEEAYADTLGGSARPVYCARAIREGEQPDELGYVTTYRVTWYVLDKYIAFDDALLRWHQTAGEDVPESDLCDWDEADEIEELDAIPAEENKMTYNINYHTGAGDETVTGTLAKAMAAADDGAAYTQQDITISDERGQEVARRHWWGVEYDPDESDEDAGNILSFGSYGYYSAWILA